VRVRPKALEAYRVIAGEERIARVRERGQSLRGLRVLELSSTATGGGVAEMLSSLVPLERDVGLDVEWRVIAGDREFFEITKRIHNGLQGMPVQLTTREQRIYLERNERNARALDGQFDVIIVHDPQPAAIRRFAPHLGRCWLWRCHVDSSTPHPPVWEFLRAEIERHDLAVFTMPEFVPADLAIPTTQLVPAIDPVSSKNRALPAYLARETAAELGVDLSRPLLLQVSRFDPWKDPLGVIAVWREVRETFPGLQLALVGSMAADDPEGWRLYAQIEAEIADEPHCLLLTDQMGVGHHEVNALQRVADVAIQKSTREGFGLIVSETMWKGTAIIAGRAGGIPLQLHGGVGGLLASTEREFVDGVLGLLEDPVHARELSAAGARRVRERFLLPRLLEDQLDLLGRIVAVGGGSGLDQAVIDRVAHEL
jgi:trehalose synthase